MQDAGACDLATDPHRRFRTGDARTRRLAAVLADHDFLEEAERHYRRAVELGSRSRRVRARPRRPCWSVPVAGSAPPERRQTRDQEAAAQLVVQGPRDRRPSVRPAARPGSASSGSGRRRGELRPEDHRTWLGDAFSSEPPPNTESGRFLAEAYLRMRPAQRRASAEANARAHRRGRSPATWRACSGLERVRTARGDLAGAIEVLRRLVDADPRRAPRYLQRMAEHSPRALPRRGRGSLRRRGGLPNAGRCGGSSSPRRSLSSAPGHGARADGELPPGDRAQ